MSKDDSAMLYEDVSDDEIPESEQQHVIKKLSTGYMQLSKWKQWVMYWLAPTTLIETLTSPSVDYTAKFVTLAIGLAPLSALRLWLLTKLIPELSGLLRMNAMRQFRATPRLARIDSETLEMWLYAPEAPTEEEKEGIRHIFNANGFEERILVDSDLSLIFRASSNPTKAQEMVANLKELLRYDLNHPIMVSLLLRGLKITELVAFQKKYPEILQLILNQHWRAPEQAEQDFHDLITTVGDQTLFADKAPEIEDIHLLIAVVNLSMAGLCNEENFSLVKNWVSDAEDPAQNVLLLIKMREAHLLNQPNLHVALRLNLYVLSRVPNLLEKSTRHLSSEEDKQKYFDFLVEEPKLRIFQILKGRDYYLLQNLSQCMTYIDYLLEINFTGLGEDEADAAFCATLFAKCEKIITGEGNIAALQEYVTDYIQKQSDDAYAGSIRSQSEYTETDTDDLHHPPLFNRAVLDELGDKVVAFALAMS